MIMQFKDKELEEDIINNAVDVMQGLLPTEVLLDNQANISIVHPMLLSVCKGSQAEDQS
jgi:hypothetical protein